MKGLFDPIAVKQLELKNRIVMSPMCQYKAQDGVPNDWHLQHYGSRAIGGTGLILLEMTSPQPNGRITEHCLGLWSEEQLQGHRRIVDFCHQYEAKVGVQIGHAGRKSQLLEGTVAPSAIAFSDSLPMPREMTVAEIEETIHSFAVSAELAVKAGFDTIELHGAHGYLLHQFLSPATNRRKDKYGDYSRLALEVIREVKQRMPEHMPLILRVSAVEYGAGGYAFPYLLEIIPQFIEAGVDLFDVSTGGDSPVRPQVYPAYQLPYAAEVKSRFDIPVMSVGGLGHAALADAAVRNGQADLVAIGKPLLRNPYWAKEAAVSRGVDMKLPGEYNLGF